MNREIDLSLLRAFLVVVETQSVTRAAAQLHQTQAAISQKLKRLEDMLESELFSREGRKIALTRCGEKLVGPASKLLDLNDETIGMMRAPEFEGEVKLGVAHDIIAKFIPSILRSFNKSWPNVDVTLIGGMTMDLKKQVESGIIDLALGTEANVGRDAVSLMSDPLVWVGAKNGSAYARDPLPISFGGPDCAFRGVSQDAIIAMGREWRSVSDTVHSAPFYVTLEADLAITTAMRSTIPDNLEEIPVSAGFPKLPDFHFTLTMPKHSQNPLAQKLTDDIFTAFNNLHRSLRALSF